jgi:SnoaL-like domain
MALTAEDRAAIAALISMHGHLVDAGELDRLDELFTADVTDLGAGPLEGWRRSGRPPWRWAS